MKLLLTSGGVTMMVGDGAGTVVGATVVGAAVLVVLRCRVVVVGQW